MATFEDVDDMSVKQLKAVIEEQGLSHVGCTEKSELRDRAREAIAKGASQSGGGTRASVHERAGATTSRRMSRANGREGDGSPIAARMVFF